MAALRPLVVALVPLFVSSFAQVATSDTGFPSTSTSNSLAGAGSLTGSLTGAVSGALTGSATGSGSLTGSVTGSVLAAVSVLAQGLAPVNLVTSQAERVTKGVNFDLNYQRSLVGSLAWTASGVLQVVPDSSRPCELEYAGVFYKLVNVLVHVQAEHVVNGLLAPLEIHFVHESKEVAGQLLVLVSSFTLHPLNQGNSFLQLVLGAAGSLSSPGSSLSLSGPLDFLQCISPAGYGLPLLGKLSTVNVFSYLGSLPSLGTGSTGGVPDLTWLVIDPLKGPTLSLTQLLALKGLVAKIVAGAVSAVGTVTSVVPPVVRTCNNLKVFSCYL